MLKSIFLFFKLPFIALFFILSIKCAAQKLPKLQTQGMAIPPKLLIDGKLIEWGNTTQAFNNNAKIYYTIANDDARLYIALKISDDAVIRKAIAGSITFTFRSADEKDKLNRVAVTYPIFDKKDRPNINLTAKPKFDRDSVSYKIGIDSFVRAGNYELKRKTKEIKIVGGKGIDTLISIYNEEGIKAVSLFDKKASYVVEILIPLKYFGFTNKKTSDIAYNIMLNGAANPEGARIEEIEGGIRVVTPNGKFIPPVDDMRYTLYPTDFGAVYKMVKK